MDIAENNITSFNWNIVNTLNKDISSKDFRLFWKKASGLGITKKQYSKTLHINVRTLDRNLNQEFTLKIDKYESVIRIYLMMKHGIDVFGSEEKFGKWLHDENMALGKKPIDLLESIAGIEIVDNSLTRIEHGIF